LTMAWKVTLLLLCLVLGALAQSRTQISVIDDYSAVSAPLVIVITPTTVLPETLASFTLDNGILGGERDLILTAQNGTIGKILSVGVNEDTWSVSSPPQASGIAVCQYDGVDNSTNINVKGLGGVDLTTSSVDSFLLSITSDVTTTYTIDVTDLVGGSSTQDIQIPGDPDVLNDYYVTFVTFHGNADFTNVGSIVITIHAFDNVDTSVDIFALAAPTTTPVSVTPTPSPSNNASPVPPPPPASSPSSVPVPGQTWYRFDDDDDGKSPCGDERDDNTVFLADYNAIYYYFYGFQRPNVYVENDNSASLLISSLFACILAFFAL